MKMQRLVIKGGKKNATREAARHGVTVRSCRTTKHDTTLCDAPCAQWREVGEWFREHRTQRAGRGFSPGSLLFYAGCDAKDLRGARRRRRRR